MAARTSTRARATDDGMAAFDVAGKNVHKTALADELKTSFLEYAYSVIHSRALPDARDGLKPVHRRILFHMADAGITPDKGHVKSARVVGDVMGRYHPHGDSAIYDALVRMAQPFSLNVPLIDPHGNFGGEPGDSAAAYRYTECRLAHPALSLTDELGEDTVDWVPNYDESLKQPSVLPAAFPNLLVNGSDGIAVGMATNMPPHNLGEVCDAARHLVLNPDATLARLRKFIPGPDLPTGGQIIGADEIDKAYKTGRGVFRIRATVDVGPLPNSRGRNAITITELPYSVGPEKVIEKIKAEMGKNRLSGIADVKNLSDRNNKLRLVIECKTGVNPQALLADLWKYTQLQESFGVNNLALIGGEPRTLGLRELLEAWVNHRLEVVRRRTRHRLQKAKDRLHIVEGLLIALDNIDRVVKLIRASKTTDEAKTALIKAFKLSDVQATYILDMPLRRLTALEADKLRAEASELRERITALQTLLDDEAELRKVIAGELAEVKKRYATPRRTVLVDGDLAEVLAETAAQAAAVPKEIADDPVTVWLSTTGLLGRSAAKTEVVNGPASTRSRAHSAVAGESLSTARGAVLVITNRGRAVKVDVLDLPVIPPGPKGEGPSLRAGAAAVDVAALAPGEHAVGIVPFGKAAEGGVGVAMGTRMGVVKVSQTDWPVRGDQWDVIGLKDGDEVVSATWLASPDADLVFVTSDAQLLRFDAAKVRPQGRLAGGMAGINLGAGASVLAFAVVPRSSAEMLWQSLVVTSTAKSTKVTPLDEYPSKGRATGGVRCQRFVKGEDALVAAWVGQQPAATDGAGGEPLRLPGVDMRRDGSGAPAVPPTTLGGTGRHPSM